MTDYVHDLELQGVKDSSGVFTMDAGKALEKMRSHLFASAESYLLNVVAAAHLLQATRIHLYLDADDVMVTFDGEAVSPEVLQDFARPVSHQLTLALLGASPLQPRLLRFESHGAAQSSVLSWEEGGLPRVGSYTPKLVPAYVNRFWLRRTVSVQVLGRFLNPFSERPERALLRDRCRWSRLDIYSGGKSLLGSRRLPGGPLCLRLGQPGWSVEGPFIQVQDTPLCGWLCLQSTEKPAAVQVILGGVLYELGPVSTLPPGLEAWIWDPDLSTDVSGAAIVEDEACRRMIEGLRHNLGQALQRQYLEVRPFVHAKALLWFVEHFWERWEQAGVNLAAIAFVENQAGEPLPLAESMLRFSKKILYLGEAGAPAQLPDGTPLYKIREGMSEAVRLAYLNICRMHHQADGRCAPWNLGSAPEMSLGSRYLARRPLRGQLRAQVSLIHLHDWPKWLDANGPAVRVVDYLNGYFQQDVLISVGQSRLPGGLEIVLDGSLGLQALSECYTSLQERICDLFHGLQIEASQYQAHLCCQLLWARLTQQPLPPALFKVRCFRSSQPGLLSFNQLLDGAIYLVTDLEAWQRDIVLWALPHYRANPPT